MFCLDVSAIVGEKKEMELGPCTTEKPGFDNVCSRSPPFEDNELVLENITSFLRFKDVLSFGATCSSYHSFVKQSRKAQFQFLAQLRQFLIGKDNNVQDSEVETVDISLFHPVLNRLSAHMQGKLHMLNIKRSGFPEIRNKAIRQVLERMIRDGTMSFITFEDSRIDFANYAVGSGLIVSDNYARHVTFAFYPRNLERMSIDSPHIVISQSSVCRNIEDTEEKYELCISTNNKDLAEKLHLEETISHKNSVQYLLASYSYKNNKNLTFHGRSIVRALKK
jgi:hypothetical protein